MRRPIDSNLFTININKQFFNNLIRRTCQSAYSFLCQISAWGSFIDEIMYPDGFLFKYLVGIDISPRHDDP
jgi:hypothetical protein